MKLLNRIGYLILALLVLVLIARSCLIRIEIGQTGVLTEEWGSGLVPKDFGPGFHLDLGPLHSWTIYDSTVQTLAMTQRDPEGPLQVKSDDGATVTMDVTIKYRIKPGETWKLRKELGVGDSYKVKVRNEAIDALRPIFGRMRTEDFYDPKKREEKAAESEKFLAERLDILHVSLIQILVRDVSFEEAYEQRIKEKALAQQDIEVNIAQREAAQYLGETQKIEAETEAKIRVIDSNLQKEIRSLTAENEKKIEKIRADTEKFVIETKAEADLYAKQKEAESLLLTKNAEAEAQAMKQKVLVGSGARNLVALEAAENLNFQRFVISTLDNNLLDLLKMATKLGADPVKK